MSINIYIYIYTSVDLCIYIHRGMRIISLRGLAAILSIRQLCLRMCLRSSMHNTVQDHTHDPRRPNTPRRQTNHDAQANHDALTNKQISTNKQNATTNSQTNKPRRTYKPRRQTNHNDQTHCDAQTNRDEQSNHDDKETRTDKVSSPVVLSYCCLLLKTILVLEPLQLRMTVLQFTLALIKCFGINIVLT